MELNDLGNMTGQTTKFEVVYAKIPACFRTNLAKAAGVRCSRADCARDVCAGEDEPVSALSLELRQPAPSRAAQHPLQVPHRQAFSGLRVDRRLGAIALLKKCVQRGLSLEPAVSHISAAR